MPASNEHIPNDKLRNAIVGDAVQPKINELSKALKINTFSSVIISVRGKDVKIFGPETSKWRIRLIVRNTFHDDRKNFQAHVFIERDETTGFTGFHMPGTVRINGAGITVEPKGWTGLYNSAPATKWI